MNLLEHITEKLNNDETFQLLVGENLFNAEKEQEVPIPSVIMDDDLLESYEDLEGEVYRDTAVTFEIYASDSDVAIEISNCIQSCFYKYAGTIEDSEIQEVSLSEDKQDRWSDLLNCARRILVLEISHCAA